VRNAAVSLRLVHYGMPLFPVMHEMGAELPHEEIQLLAVEFESMFFESAYDVPGYSRWYRSHDQTTAYRFMRTMLQAMQWLRGGRRWLLKSPQHLEQLPVLLDVFPDAIVVQTHRDPVAVTASLVTMEAYTRRMQHRRVDLRGVGAYWSERIEAMLRASVDDRARIPEGRVLDVAFHEFMADQMATVDRREKAAGLEFDQHARRRVGRFLDEHPRGKHGTIHYDLARFGIDPAERRDAFRFYTDLFQVPLER
jgi:PAS domain-containing protein